MSMLRSKFRIRVRYLSLNDGNTLSVFVSVKIFVFNIETKSIRPARN